MLRIIQNSSPAGAKSYYSTADYYTEGQELVGQWRGEGAGQLGLSGQIMPESWDALCDNRHPGRDEPLTLRRKQERRVGYDCNFHVPKSVSLLYSISKDERLLDAFRESVDATMQDMEAEMQTRVPKQGSNEDRTTGNMVWGEFVHFTARPIDGIPDPHLHAHCFVFNTTWDDKEHAWKAGQFAGLKRDAPYFEAVFHARLAHRLGDLGLEVERKKWGWELAGLDKATLDKFSRRTAQIEDEARKLGVLDPEAKSELGAKTRERKKKDLTLDELRPEWASRLSKDERAALDALMNKVGGSAIPEDSDAAREAVERATEHCFERKSVVPERTLLAESLKRSVGKASLQSVERAFRKQDLVTALRDGRQMVTTPEVLAEEKRLLAFARQGRGTQTRLGTGTHPFQREWLNDGQRLAVTHVLGSRDRVMLIRGAAGVGKTSMMQEAVEGIQAGGK
jgi:conjugative relaxase-like TrwC/TraI family protein